jgi:galactokinase
VFYDKFQEKEYRTFFAPGRINLIGEHTDYNGGYVFPCALTFGTYALARKNGGQFVRMYSMNFPEKGIIEFSLTDLKYQREHDWGNYPKGMIAYFLADGFVIDQGINVVFYGEIPNGAGLSSSASIEVLTGIMLEGLFGLKIDRLELVKIAKQVENNFIGVNCGIMDQFAIGMGKTNCGILLDCEHLKYSYAPLSLDKHNIVIMNTNKRRELADSKYNERRAECETALSELQKVMHVSSLCELDVKTFEANQAVIANSIRRKRARHVVTENARTVQALEELQRGNLKVFGKLMNESHISLRDDYEVTGVELDTLAETAWQQPGVLGARMTGAGFGGCAIAIVEKDQTRQFIAKVGETYRQKVGYDAAFYIANIGDGAKEI